MMRGLWVAAIVAALAAASPAAAADLATLGCVRDGLSAAVRADIAASGQALTDGKQPVAVESTHQALVDAAAICAKRYGWSKPASDAAVFHAIGSIGLDAIRPLAKGRGISVESVEAAIHALTAEQRTQVRNQEDAGINALGAQFLRQGVSIADDAHGNMAGTLAVFMLMQEMAQANFAAS